MDHTSPQARSIAQNQPTNLPASNPTTRVLRSQASKSVQTTPNHPGSPSKGSKNTTKRRKRLDPWYPKRKVTKNPKPRAPPPSHFTCRICISHLPSDNFIRWVPPIRSSGKPLDAPKACIPHLARNPSRRNDPVCKACVGAFMAARLDTHGVQRVSQGCVEPGCTTKWSWKKVIAYFPRDRLEAYNLAAFEHWCANANLFACLAPGCDAVALADSTVLGYPQVECTSLTCKARWCAVCRTAWHADQTCAEVHAAAVTAQISDAERETLALMQVRDAKRCPNCQLVIERDGGCSSMFCTGCQKSFNWDVAASAVPGALKAVTAVDGQPERLALCEADIPIVGNRAHIDKESFRDCEWWFLPECSLGVDMLEVDDPDL